MAGTGILVFFLTNFLTFIGVVNVDESLVAEVVVSVLNIVSFVWMVWGQLRRKDLENGLWRV